MAPALSTAAFFFKTRKGYYNMKQDRAPALSTAHFSL